MTTTLRNLSITALAAATLALSGSGADAMGHTEKIQPELKEAMDASAPSDVGRAAQPEPVSHRVVVILKAPEGMAPTDMNLRTSSDMARLQDQVSRMQESVFTKRLDGSYKMLNQYKSMYGFSATADPAAIDALAQLDEVERIELMPVHYKMSGQSHPLVNMGEVHDLGFTGDGVTIAIIDDGIDHDHAAFGGSANFPNAKIVGGRDFADNDDDPTIDCTDQSHGTAVAGVAAGNGGGITGTAPDAQIVMLKVQSAGRCGQPTLDGDLAGAIDWVVTHREEFGIRVLSMSLGALRFDNVADCEDSSLAIRNAVNAVAASGVAVLSASGNDGLCNEISRPACIGNSISVGASNDASLGTRSFCVNFDSCGGRIDFSCRTRRICSNGNDPDDVACYSNSSDFLDILAPSDCASTARAGGGTNNCFNGTSSATPFAAGVAASLIEANDGLDNEGVRAALAGTGVPVTDAKNGRVTPRVDALAAVRDVMAPVDCPEVGLLTDFEGDITGWTSSGLWNLVTDTACADPSASSGSRAMYYGREAGCNYDAGDNNGELLSPPISGVTASSTLSFQYFRQVESFAGGSFDRTSVDVVASDGSVTNVFSRDSTDASAADWLSSGEIDLSAFAGDTIQVRFNFDTMDGVANDFTGWLIDDVEVTGLSMCGDA